MRITIAEINEILLGQSRFDRVIEGILESENPGYKNRTEKNERPESLKNRTSILILNRGDTPEDDIELTIYYLNKLTSPGVKIKKNIPFKLNKGEKIEDNLPALKFRLLIEKICDSGNSTAISRISTLTELLNNFLFNLLHDKISTKVFAEYGQDIVELGKNFIISFAEHYTASEKVIGQYDIDINDFISIVRESIISAYKTNIGFNHFDEFYSAMLGTGAFSVAGLDRLVGTVISDRPNPLSALVLGNRFLYQGELQLAYDLFSYQLDDSIDRRFASLDTSIADLILNYDRLKGKYGKKAEVEELESLTEQERINLAAEHLKNALKSGVPVAVNLLYSQYDKLCTAPGIPSKEAVIERLKNEPCVNKDIQYPFIYNNLYSLYKETDESQAYYYLSKGAELDEQYALYRYAEHLLTEGKYEDALDMLLKSIYQAAWTLDYTPLPLLIKYFYLDTRGAEVRSEKDEKNKFPYRILINDSYINLLDMSDEDKKSYLEFAIDNIKESHKEYIKMAEELLISSGEFAMGEITGVEDDYRFVSRDKYASYTVRLDNQISGFDTITVTQKNSGFKIGERIKVLISNIHQPDIIAIDKEILI